MLWGKQSRVRATGSGEVKVKLCKRLASFGLPGQKPVSSGLKEVKEFVEQISEEERPRQREQQVQRSCCRSPSEMFGSSKGVRVIAMGVILGGEVRGNGDQIT